tara:strand:+ start:3096 stop:3317 length:222 start_codon:yes stop_codon:yes gene_type:complete
MTFQTIDFPPLQPVYPYRKNEGLPDLCSYRVADESQVDLHRKNEDQELAVGVVFVAAESLVTVIFLPQQVVYL